MNTHPTLCLQLDCDFMSCGLKCVFSFHSCFAYLYIFSHTKTLPSSYWNISFPQDSMFKKEEYALLFILNYCLATVWVSLVGRRDPDRHWILCVFVLFHLFILAYSFGMMGKRIATMSVRTLLWFLTFYHLFFLLVSILIYLSGSFFFPTLLFVDLYSNIFMLQYLLCSVLSYLYVYHERCRRLFIPLYAGFDVSLIMLSNIYAYACPACPSLRDFASFLELQYCKLYQVIETGIYGLFVLLLHMLHIFSGI